MCLKYGYEVEFTGVGQAPPGQQERVGFCSQIGVFHRLGAGGHCNRFFGDDADDVLSYTLVSRFLSCGQFVVDLNYPFLSLQSFTLPPTVTIK